MCKVIYLDTRFNRELGQVNQDKKASSRGLNAGQSQTVHSADMLVYTLLICRVTTNLTT
ncbi:hypothetical protein [Lactiplantibacillus pentosus]|uniref:hypothetical protein n=1 Tax=Lactiplantibacillus pentosus TaxID=1589 RepID=UPI001ADDDA0D|nr:hypothetical protein [Lactiplantibacillus pentosus]MBO9165877.1 hypothetical protein [Lactiplantibacillus pentosus]